MTFPTEAQLEAFAAEAERTGLPVARDIDVSAQQWKLIVADGFDFKAHGL